MTTSGFTAHAIDFAKSIEGIVLVDGTRLVNLMMDHEVGVTSRLLKIPALDRNYFDEE
ncbi:restriction endonuclease [Pseudomonas sp. B21-019]|uniref:restriction endonuclease n=1 Tax=Pseudomonas sp. B21-019 TaxID=2895475 RepID=UPI002852E548|nr:restriction endonuclease [Pseudomonas sp. B21-019]